SAAATRSIGRPATVESLQTQSETAASGTACRQLSAGKRAPPSRQRWRYQLGRLSHPGRRRHHGRDGPGRGWRQRREDLFLLEDDSPFAAQRIEQGSVAVSNRGRCTKVTCHPCPC